MSPQPNPNKDSNPRNSYIRFSGLAFQILAAIFLGIWGGMKLDAWLNLKYPIFTLVLAMVTLLGSIYYLIKSLPKSS